MPLMHSENPADGEECLRLFNEIKNRLIESGKTDLIGSADGFIKFTQSHLDITQKFGRYPARNAALGRESTPEEIEYLKSADTFG